MIMCMQIQVQNQNPLNFYYYCVGLCIKKKIVPKWRKHTARWSKYYNYKILNVHRCIFFFFFFCVLFDAAHYTFAALSVSVPHIYGFHCSHTPTLDLKSRIIHPPFRFVPTFRLVVLLLQDYHDARLYIFWLAQWCTKQQKLFASAKLFSALQSMQAGKRAYLYACHGAVGTSKAHTTNNTLHFFSAFFVELMGRRFNVFFYDIFLSWLFFCCCCCWLVLYFSPVLALNSYLHFNFKL